MKRRLSVVLALGFILGCGSSVREHGTYRPVATFRQWRGERHLTAHVRLARGSLRVVPGHSDELYRVTTGYSDEAQLPIGVYNAADTTLRIGYQGDNEEPDSSIRFSITSEESHPAPATTLALSPQTNAALKLELVGVNSELELGGLRISTVRVDAVAGRTTLRFSQPNAALCEEASVTVAAGELSMVGLGNSQCGRMTVQGVAGKVTLDFGGAWPTDATMQASIAVGSLKLRLPRDVGVRLTPRNKLLAGMEPDGLVRQGDSFVSPGYDRATRHLDIDATAVLGGTSVEWISE